MIMQNNNGLGLTQQQNVNGRFVNKDLLAKAKTNDADAFFSIGIVLLQRNTLGAAERGLTFAARAGHKMAERATALRKQYDNIEDWRDTVLYLFNNSIL